MHCSLFTLWFSYSFNNLWRTLYIRQNAKKILLWFRTRQNALRIYVHKQCISRWILRFIKLHLLWRKLYAFNQKMKIYEILIQSLTLTVPHLMTNSSIKPFFWKNLERFFVCFNYKSTFLSDYLISLNIGLFYFSFQWLFLL